MRQFLKVTLVATFLLTGANLFAQTVKLGHINSNELLSIMPEKEQAQKQIQAKAEEKELNANKPVEKTASKISHEEQKELKRLERQISKLEEKKAAISDQFNDTSLSPEKIAELSKELNELTEELEEKEMQWMELVDGID